jgi:glycosyltransferase involved in cell wall biosynthesis
MGTIFPFWVPSCGANAAEDSEASRPGYVELPYTLVQDFNLFIVLQEKSIDLWKRKLAWIASQGGMAFLDTHPDYMCFGPESPKIDEFPIAWYREWLQHVRNDYAGRYWHALPAEAARFYKTQCPLVPAPAHRRVCMLSYSFYEMDNRVRRYAEALVKQGCAVDAIALKREDSQPDYEVIDGVSVFRIQKRQKNETSSLQHMIRLCGFGLRSAKRLRRFRSTRAYALIHVHNPPDFMVFAARVSKRHGAKLILDVHDIVPELYGAKFPSWSTNSIVAALKWIEKLSMRFVDHVIVSNHLWYQTIIDRSASPEETAVFINHVDPAIFYPHPRTREDGGFVISFPGSLSWHQGLDIAIKAFAKIQHELPNPQFHIYGVGQAKESLIALVKDLGLRARVQFRDVVPLQSVPEIMANSDLGVVPKRADSFGNEAYSTKIMEFMAQGVPVIVSRTKIDDYYFNDSVVCFFEPENVDQLAEAILRLSRDKEYGERLIGNARQYADLHSWARKEQEYLDLVDALVNGRSGSGQAPAFTTVDGSGFARREKTPVAPNGF